MVLNSDSAQEPGNPRNQKAQPFYTTKGNEKRTAAYLGFENVIEFRIYVASDRFRLSFEIYQG